MPINILMPALSPTMEKGTLAKWLIKAGDVVKSGQVMAEIETDKATMEYEAVDEGTIGAILIAEGSEDVAVGAAIATLLEDGETAASTKPSPPAGAGARLSEPSSARLVAAGEGTLPLAAHPSHAPAGHPLPQGEKGRIVASPLAKRIASQSNINLASVKGSGPNGRIVKADLADAPKQAAPAKQGAPKPVLVTAHVPTTPTDGTTPFTEVKLSGMRKVIARRLTESKQQVPHIYLSVDIRLDALLKLRSELNAALATRQIKLSVNDMLIKALGLALVQVPVCNVSFMGDTMLQYTRADISVAVSIPGGLITPIVVDAGHKSLATVATEMTTLAEKAKAGKLQPHEYQGGTASLSNMGMMGIKQFEAVINPPQGMIMAIGAGEQRPYVIDGILAVATVMTATGSFDHRAIDGADGAMLMKAFKELVEMPLGLVA